jgi:outer membrane protein TolC
MKHILVALACAGAVTLVPAIAEDGGSPQPLTLDDVVRSVERHFPLLLAAEKEREIAEGRRISALGGFDTKLGVIGDTVPAGFYQTDRLDLLVTQPLKTGGIDIFSGYRIGRGEFAIWNKGRQTNLDGELRLGARLPLLRNRSIDERRADLQRAEIDVRGAEPVVFRRQLEARRLGELAYWEWVSAGEKHRIAQNLLRLAEDRQDVLAEAVGEGLVAEIVLVDNERLIAERRALNLDTERLLQQAAIELSLYLRDDSGMPVIPRSDRLPDGFPPLVKPGADLVEDIDRALAARPELEQLSLERERQSVDMARSRNQMLPDLNLFVEGSKDLGEAANDPDDKGPFVFKAGVVIGLPVQRRAARGQIRSIEAELTRLDLRLRFERDRVATEVRDAHSAWVQAYRRFEQATRSVELARELEEAERFQVVEGNSDLLRLNIREQQTAQAASFLVDVMTEYFEARSIYHAAIGGTSAAAS